MVVAFCCSAWLALFAQAMPAVDGVQVALAQGIETPVVVGDSVRLDLEVLRAVGEQPLAAGQRVYTMELLYADLTISFEENFLEQQMVDLWRKPLDLQVDLRTSWAAESKSWFASSKAPEDGTSLVIDNDKGFVSRLPNQGDGWVRFRLRQELIMTNVGEWEFPAAQLKLAWATRFEDDLVRGAIPLDRQEATIESKAWKGYTVEPPVAGRPSDFMGSVGRFTMELQSKLASEQPDPSTAMLHVRIAFRGEGYLNPLFTWSPDFGHFFPKRGAFIEMHPEGLTWVGEVQSIDLDTELPSVSWSYFDPTDGGHYETLHTPGGWQGSLVFHTGRLPWIIGGGLLFVLGMLHLQRRRVATYQSAVVKTPSAPATVAQTPTPRPMSASASAAAKKPVRVTPTPRDLIDYLAAFLDCRREQIYADDLQVRLSKTNLPDPLVRDLCRAIRSIHQARYAQQGAVPSEQDLTELTQRLQSYD